VGLTSLTSFGSSSGRNLSHTCTGAAATLDAHEQRHVVQSGILSGRSHFGIMRGHCEDPGVCIFAWDDPLPGLLDLPLFAGTLGKRVLQRKKALALSAKQPHLQCMNDYDSNTCCTPIVERLAGTHVRWSGQGSFPGLSRPARRSRRRFSGQTN